MANSNKKYSKRRSINKNRNNYAKKNVLNKQSRLSQKGGWGCDKSKKKINELESIKKKIEDDLSKEKRILETVKKALVNLPSDFLQGATDYVKSHSKYKELWVEFDRADNVRMETERGILTNGVPFDGDTNRISAEIMALRLKYNIEYISNQHNLSKLLTPIIAKLKPIL
jgi:transposase